MNLEQQNLKSVRGPTIKCWMSGSPEGGTWRFIATSAGCSLPLLGRKRICRVVQSGLRVAIV